MSLIAMIGIGFGLAMDATAVAIGVTVVLGKATARQIFRFVFHFGFFQAAMPVVGWLAGRGLHRYVHTWDHWVAFSLLAIIGVKAIVDVIREGDEPERKVTDPTRGMSLVILSVATSIDALAVGMSLALLHVSIWYPAAIIGVVTAFLTFCGMRLGCYVGKRFGLRVRILGGIILIGIGIKILLEHLLG